MVLFMLCSAVLVDWLLLKPCCVEMLFVMYVGSVFSSVLAITDRGEMGLYDVAITDSGDMGLYDVPMFMSLFGFVIGMMFSCFHV